MGHDQFLALLSFVRDDVEGIQQVRRYETAQLVILTLAEEGMDALALLRRCCHLEFGERLIGVVREYYEGKQQWSQFISAIVQMSNAWWDENGTDPRNVLKMLRGHEILAYLFDKHAELVTHPEHPLYCGYDVAVADDYWKHQVRRFIVKSDFRRAWDEVQKANRGMLKATINHEEYPDPMVFMDVCHDRSNRCWFASREAVSALIIELYQAMRDQGMITAILEADLITTKDGQMSGVVYETKMPRAHRYKPREYSRRIQQPGHDLAMKFVESKIGDERMWPEKFRLTEAGAAVLKIAAHFRQQRNERRRQKHAKAVAEYEASHK